MWASSTFSAVLSVSDIGGLGAGIVVILILWACRKVRFFRFDRDSVFSEDRDRILTTYGKVALLTNVVAVVASGILVYPFYKGLAAIHRMVNPAPPDAAIALRVPAAIWVIVGCVLAGFSGFWIACLFTRLRLRERYPEFWIFDGLKNGFRFQRMMLVATVLSLVLVFGMGGRFAMARADFGTCGVTIRGFVSSEERSYGYVRVARILDEYSFKAPAGNIVRERRQTIRFDDGTEWNSLPSVVGVSPKDGAFVLKYVSEASGVRIEVVDPYAE